MFNQPFQPLLPELIPFGIYTIPEVRYKRGESRQQREERAKRQIEKISGNRNILNSLHLLTLLSLFLSMVGKTEQQLTKENIPYEYGLSRYSELAKGMMQGDSTGGLLKILFHSEVLREKR
jgi:hypothetical protein